MNKTPRNEFDRLRNQDPAQGIEFDQDSLIANLKGRLPEGLIADGFPVSVVGQAEPANGVPAAADGKQTTQNTTDTNTVHGASDSAGTGHSKSEQESGSSAPVVPLRKSKFTPTWGHLVASVAVTALVVGAGPALLSSTGSSSEGIMTDMAAGTDAGAEIASSGSAPLSATSGSVTETAPGNALGTESFRNPQPTGESADSAARTSWAMSQDSGTRFFGSGLSADTGQGHLFGFDASANVTEEYFDGLKSAFGISEPTRVEWGSYAAGEDGGASIFLSGGSLANFNFNNFAEVSDAELLSEEKAIEQAQQLMSDVGLDVANFEFSAQQATSYLWSVPGDNARETAEAQPFEGEGADTQSIEPDVRAPDAATQQPSMQVSAQLKVLGGDSSEGSWSFEFVGNTIQSAYGQLAEVVDLGEYQTISPVQAVERINDGWFGVFGIIYPDNWVGHFQPAMIEESVTVQDSAPAAASVPGGGSKLPWRVADVKLKDPVLNHGTVWQDGSAILVPVWQFSSESGLEYQVLALADSELDLQK